MLGTVGGNPKVESLAGTIAEMLLPGRLILPEMGNGVSDENDFARTFGDSLFEKIMTLHLPGIRLITPVIGRDGSDVGESRQCRNQRQN